MAIPMPSYRGKFFAQTVTTRVRVATGKRYPWTPPGSDKQIWLPVKESRIECSWTWDGSRWLTDAEWKKKFPRKRDGKVLVSKHDFNLGGHGSMSARLRNRAKLK